MFEQTSLSDRFRRRNLIPDTDPRGDIRFVVSFDSFGAYLEVKDAEGTVVRPDYQSYTGPMRSLLRMLHQLQERRDFIIDWEKPADRIYLGEHEFLLWQLKICGNLYDEYGNLLHFAEGKAQVSIQIDEVPDSDKLRSFLITERESRIAEDLMVLSECFLLCEQEVYEIAPLGDAYEDLYLFQTELSQHELEPFLSLLFSYVDHIDLRYRGYKITRQKEPVIPQPCLILETIDQEDALHLRVSQQLPSIGFDFMDTYELSHLAEVNDLEKRIVIRPIESQQLGKWVGEIRDLLYEHATTAKIRKELVMQGNRFIIPEVIAGEFIYHELPSLLNRYQFFGAERLKSYKVRAIHPRLNLSLQSGIDFFDGEAFLDFEGESVALLDALQQYKQQRYIQLTDGTHAIVRKEYFSKLERLFLKGKEGNIRLSFFDLPEVELLIAGKLSGERFSHSREVFQGFNQLNELEVPEPQVNATMRPYQEFGYRWLHYLHENKLGGCLADDMGLGKTLQTLAILQSNVPKSENPSLIVMPRSLLFNWGREIEKFTPELTSKTYYGPQRDWEEVADANLILTTYGTLRNDIQHFKEIPFYYVVLDESQNIKNYQSQVAKAVTLLQAEHRLGLSGTPIENHLGELYSLFRFLNPAMFGSVRRFNEHYAVPIQRENDKNVMAELRAKISPFVLRRLKQDVLDDLPDKIEQVLYVEMSTEQAALYDERRRFYQDLIQQQIATEGLQKSRFAILQGLSELRQLAAIPEAKTEGLIRSPKLEILREQLEEAFANGHKVLIFANFLAAIESISEMLESLDINYVSMTGATRDRQERVEYFQREESCKAFVMTLKTGGLGLNLTAADTIFLFDPWWNVAAEHQAVDRAHRIGQKQTVTSYKLITRNTIEEKILKLQEKKQELFDQIISTDSAALKTLSEDDIDYILG